MTALLTLDGVSRSYRDGRGIRRALDGIDLALAPGELVAVMGPSGSGKSTLLNMAAGLERPNKGTVSLHGAALRYSRREQSRRLREQVGFVYQDGNLLRDLTALQNVSLPLELIGTPRRLALDEARAALAQVGVEGEAAAYPDDLSGGQRQRVAVARALVGPRRILLADEPTGALESDAAEQLLRLIRGRARDGRGAIVATHDQRLAAFADRVIYLRDGAIVGEAVAVDDRVEVDA
jgi:putative ABC transport system ATP-binding protein